MAQSKGSRSDGQSKVLGGTARRRCVSWLCADLVRSAHTAATRDARELFELFITQQLKPSCPMPPQHGGGLRVQRTVVAWRHSYADLLISDIATCRIPHLLKFALRLMTNCSPKFCTMRDIYCTHSSPRKEVNIILCVNAVITYSYPLAR